MLYIPHDFMLEVHELMCQQHSVISHVDLSFSTKKKHFNVKKLSVL